MIQDKMIQDDSYLILISCNKSEQPGFYILYLIYQTPDSHILNNANTWHILRIAEIEHT